MIRLAAIIFTLLLLCGGGLWLILHRGHSAKDQSADGQSTPSTVIVVRGYEVDLATLPAESAARVTEILAKLHALRTERSGLAAGAERAEFEDENANKARADAQTPALENRTQAEIDRTLLEAEKAKIDTDMSLFGRADKSRLAELQRNYENSSKAPGAAYDPGQIDRLPRAGAAVDEWRRKMSSLDDQERTLEEQILKIAQSPAR